MADCFRGLRGECASRKLLYAACILNASTYVLIATCSARASNIIRILINLWSINVLLLRDKECKFASDHFGGGRGLGITPVS